MAIAVLGLWKACSSSHQELPKSSPHIFQAPYSRIDSCGSQQESFNLWKKITFGSEGDPSGRDFAIAMTKMVT